MKEWELDIINWRILNKQILSFVHGNTYGLNLMNPHGWSSRWRSVFLKISEKNFNNLSFDPTMKIVH